MKQIRIYMTALLGILLMVSCGGGGDDGPTPTPTPTPNPTPTPQTYSQTVTVGAKKDSQDVTLTNLKSSVSSIANNKPESWILLSLQNYSGSGAPTIKIEYEDNPLTTERSCSTTITASSGDKVVLTIKQQGASTPTGIDDPHNDQTDQPAYAPRR